MDPGDTWGTDPDPEKLYRSSRIWIHNTDNTESAWNKTDFHWDTIILQDKDDEKFNLYIFEMLVCLYGITLV
jgi:hypothetical protein